jgi:hypothetical protein
MAGGQHRCPVGPRRGKPAAANTLRARPGWMRRRSRTKPWLPQRIPAPMTTDAVRARRPAVPMSVTVAPTHCRRAPYLTHCRHRAAPAMHRHCRSLQHRIVIMIRIADSTVLVTGGSRGIGRAGRGSPTTRREARCPPVRADRWPIPTGESRPCGWR